MTYVPCPTCDRMVTFGDHPFCPHGRSALAVQDDTLPGGGRWCHNIDDAPLWIATKTQHRQELAARGLQIADRKSYNTDDSTPWATPTRLRPGRRDPFLHRGDMVS